MILNSRVYTPVSKVRANLVSQRFGLLTVVKLLGSYKNSHYWLCQCDCGGINETSTAALRSGNTATCGCAKRSRMLAINSARVTHGRSGTRVYASWANMMARVYDPTNTHYKRYGGRGLVVEDRFHDFNEFYDYMGDPPDGLTLERPNNEIGYVTGNIVWATQKTQQGNKSTNLIVPIGENRLIAADAAKSVGVTLGKFLYRHHNGMSIEEILSVPHNTKRPIMYRGELTSLQHISNETGIGYQCLWARVKRQGMTIEAAVLKGKP